MALATPDWRLCRTVIFTGGVLLPVVFKKSPKSKSGTLESRAGWKGLCRKGMVLLFVLIVVRLDLLMGTSYLRDTVCIAFIANEAVSIVENAVWLPVKNPHSLPLLSSTL